ncbi:fibronectin type III domain-containing protein [Arthrobacter sp. zg-Y1110]|uniref:fibronectin type III domain-containing protein n=1 Tax=Arthrobacter sp. zg-Y1110 TaxID=2886932 RepID=UPI001D1574EA|nr:fibronectin type III domain-containing protein [Arthrobacter sp. zg-Y1110]MCC3292429.1 fibronectin type III domain-containing protein [Arthrobacter sp. zg-Y1110]UWX87136.1 fibronectin type III domain-containing protein [Arthrobacter sp. zg-Y1110]
MRPPALPDLRKSSGAFDLPSIITGVVVVGILAAGVLAAIFGVIPFAQDRGAKQDLSSIRTAEGVAKSKDNRFMDHAGLLDTGYLQPSSTEKTTVKADAKGTCYVGLAKSGTGKIFYSTDAKTDPEVFEADTDTGCLTPEELAELIEEVGGIEAPKGAPENLKLVAVSPLQAKASWDPVKKASGYKVEYRVGEGAWILKEAKTTATAVTISALPEETVHVQVYAVTGESTSEPSTATVKLPDSVLKNPSFEQGAEGWYTSNAPISSAKAHFGTKSAQFSNYGEVSQTATVPAGSPVLTYWTTGAPEVHINNVKYTPASATTESGWAQYRLDLSGSVGKYVTIKFKGSSGYLDDVTLEAPMAAFAPVSTAASSNNSTATVTWGTPLFAGGTPITSYTATAWLGGEEQASTNVGPDNRAAVVRGLKVGTEYTFTVRANNAVGESEPGKTGPVEIIAGAVSNPSFELGTQGWRNYNATIISTRAHSGTKSAEFSTYGEVSQTVTVPADKPVLTYWTTTTPEIHINNAKHIPARETTDSGWSKYRLDLSASAGKSVTLLFKSSAGHLDDVTLEAPMAAFAPVSAAASSRNGTATVTWGAPLFSGGTPITSYTATAWLDGEEQASTNVGPDNRAAVVRGLKVGTEYTFTVRANNAVGESEPGKTGPVEIIAGAVSNPSFELGTQGWSTYNATIISTRAHSGTKSAEFSTYGDVSQTVTVTADKPVFTYWTTTTPEVRINGVKYTPARETTDSGWSQYRLDLSALAGKSVALLFESSAGHLDDVTLEAPVAPSVPQSVSAVSASGTAKVTWNAPAFSGGVPVTSYTVAALLDGKEVTNVQVAGSQRAATLANVTTGASYSFRVTANNSVGASVPSAVFGPLTINAGAFVNPGFEEGTTGWTGSAIITTPHSGKGSAFLQYASLSQVVTVKDEAPVLTYWFYRANPVVSVNGKIISTKSTGVVSGSWIQVSADLSAYAGSNVTLMFKNGTGSDVTFDDVSLEAK